ncbi:MAG: UDP-N-acetylmuramate dehydrogenase [Succinivibrionaceae bacterium]
MSFNLSLYNTFHVDIEAQEGIVLKDLSMLSPILKKIEENYPFIVIGEGSDILFTDHFKGIVIINRLLGIDVSEDKDYYYVTALSGENFDELIKYCLNKNIRGLENLAKIPGTVGAAPVQNIGAYGVSFSDFCRFVEVLDLKKKILTRIDASSCEFGYRTSIFKNTPQRYIITAVGLKFSKKWKPNLTYDSLKDCNLKTAIDVYEEIAKIRSKKLPDPKVLGNAGSFFKNPTIAESAFLGLLRLYPNIKYYPQTDGLIKLSAAWLIENAGCKGFRYKNAGVYAKHALIIVNHGSATPYEILYVVKHVINSVIEKFGIILEPEVRIFGSDGEIKIDCSKTI